MNYIDYDIPNSANNILQYFLRNVLHRAKKKFDVASFFLEQAEEGDDEEDVDDENHPIQEANNLIHHLISFSPFFDVFCIYYHYIGHEKIIQ